MKGIENYKDTLKKRIAILLILCVLALLAMLFGVFYLKGRFPSKSNVTDYVIGFFTGLELGFLFFMGYYYRVLKNKQILEETFLKEKDERRNLIYLKSGIWVVSILSILLIIVSLPVAYVSYEAFITLTVVAFAQFIFSALLKLYWSRKL